MSYGLDKYTVALLHFDHDFRDEGGNIWTINNSCKIIPSTKKFGNGSINNPQVNTTGNVYYAMQTSANNVNLDISDGDFTIDWWENWGQNFTNAVSVIYTTGSAGICGALFNYCLTNSQTDPRKIYLSGNGTSWDLINNQNFGDSLFNQWVHRAVVRSGAYIYTFQNGKKYNSFNIGTSKIYFNYQSNIYCMSNNGYMDEFRISKCARWTDDFIPSAFPYVKFDAEAIKDSANLLHGYK